MIKSIYSLARAIARFFRADPPETPPSPPRGNVADLTGRLTPLDRVKPQFRHLPDYTPLDEPRPTFGKRRQPPPLPANDPPSWPFKTTRDGVTCWTECGPGHCAYPGNCVASFRGSFIDTEGTRLPRGMARIGDGAPVPWPPVLDDSAEVQRRQERARATGRWPF